MPMPMFPTKEYQEHAVEMNEVEALEWARRVFGPLANIRCVDHLHCIGIGSFLLGSGNSWEEAMEDALSIGGSQRTPGWAKRTPNGANATIIIMLIVLLGFSMSILALLFWSGHLF